MSTKDPTYRERIRAVRNTWRENFDYSKMTALRQWLSHPGSHAEPTRVLVLAERVTELMVRLPHLAYGSTLPASLKLLTEVPENSVPEPGPMRFMIAGLSRLPRQSLWDETMALRRVPVEQGMDQLRSTYRFLREHDRARRSASVSYEEVIATLVPLADFLSVVMKPPQIRAKRLDGFTALTDGRHIIMPQQVDLTGNQLLNRWGYVRLLAHEIAHLEFGTFFYSFENPLGRPIWERLANRRHTFKENRGRWDADDLADRIRRNGGEPPPKEERILPHLQAVFLHFAAPTAAHGLFNIVEDVRIERLLAKKYPAIGEIAGILGEYEALLNGAMEFQKPDSMFMMALFQEAYGRKTDPPLPRSYGTAWHAVRSILRRNWLGKIAGVEASVATVIDLFDALEKHYPEHAKKQLHQLLTDRVTVSVEEMAWSLKGRLRNYDLDRFDHDAKGVSVGYPDEKTPELGKGPFFKYPEANIWNAAVLPDEVWLRHQPWKGPFESSKPIRKIERLRPFNLPMRGQFGRSRSRRDDSGPSIDFDRAYDAIAALRSGRAVDDRIYRSQRPDLTAGWTATIILDLSISMLSPRDELDGHSPIQLAKETVAALVPWLRDGGIPTAVWGANDGGPKPIDVYTIFEVEDRVDLAKLAEVHPIAYGGFRIGALLRHAAATMKKSAADHKHLVILLSDGGSRYVAPGATKHVREQSCKNCSMRPNCVMEPIDQRLSIRSPMDFHNVFFPTFYETHDVKHALKANPKVKAVFGVFGDGGSDAIFQETFGRKGFVRLQSEKSGENLRNLVVRSL